MNLNFVGDKGLPKVLFIYPIGFDENVFDNFIERLKQEYYICIVRLNDITKDSDTYYDGAKNQALKIEKKLEIIQIDDFKILFSSSLSGITAINLYANDRINFEYCILDSVPMLNIGFLKETALLSLIMKEKNNIDYHAKKNKDKLQDYLNSSIDTLVQKIKNMPTSSIKIILNDTVRFDFPQLSREKQEKLYIRYGQYDFAYKSVNKIKNTYKKSKIYVKKSLNHCQEIIEYPDNYMDFIKKIVSED